MSETSSRTKRKNVSSNSASPTRKKAKPKRSAPHYKPSGWNQPVGPDNRLLLRKELGKGVSSTVFLCTDTKTPGQEYAVKFIRLDKELRKRADNEIRLLRRLKSDATSGDSEGAKRLLCLAGIEDFEHEDHLALVFERQKCCLKTALSKYGQGGGLALVNVQNVAKDVFLALRVLRQVKILHCDLKPENLLVSLDGMSVKLADFGSATGLSTRSVTDECQPLYYRAPEVILGQAFGMEIDIWSAGLTIFETATGNHLMTGESKNIMLHAMLKTFGAFPKSFATAGKFKDEYFNSEGSFRLGYGYVPMSDFPIQPSPFRHKLAKQVKGPTEGSGKERHLRRVQQLAEFLSLCMALEPAKRATPTSLLGHAFVQL